MPEMYQQMIKPDGNTAKYALGISHDTRHRIFAVVYLAVGMIYLHFFCHFHLLTALYAFIEIVTTIGFGDFAFAESANNFDKIFVSLYVVIGLTVIAGVIMQVAQKATDRANAAFRSNLARTQMKLSGMPEEEVKEMYDEENRLIVAVLLFAFMVLFGTLFYGWYESCTCSYGLSVVHGCDPLNCESTGGYKKSYIDSFYMSCITLTTVGFGDYSPKSELGRGVGIVWMLLGVVITSNFITEMTSAFVEAEKKRKTLGRITEDTFQEIDKDGNGTLSKYEFVSFVLLQYGLVTTEQLEEITNMYDTLDVSGDGVVTYEEAELFTDTMNGDK